MPDNFVTIASFPTPLEAELVRMKLEAAEIDVFLVNSTTGGILTTLPGLQGTRVQVHEDDLEAAIEVLESDPTEIDEDSMASVERVTDAPDDDRHSRVDECPSCGASRIEEQRTFFWTLFRLLYWLVVIISLVYAKPLPKKWRCLKCGHEWKVR